MARGGSKGEGQGVWLGKGAGLEEGAGPSHHWWLAPGPGGQEVETRRPCVPTAGSKPPCLGAEATADLLTYADPSLRRSSSELRGCLI